MKMPRLAPTLALVLAALLAGCASGPPTTTEGGVPIDATRTAKGQDSRVLFLVIHYTVANFPTSMKILTEQQVSAHYLLSDEPQPRIFRLVDENRRAWHSGASAWGPNHRLNSSSIGIEIVHPGYVQLPNGQKVFAPFPQAQIDALIPLVKDIVKRHGIKPEHILGHGEVTPSYKEDPGPTFPWKLFSDLGITPPWPDAAAVAAQRAVFEAQPPEMIWIQRSLAQHGYNVQPTGVFDKQTERVLMNFQMRYRPTSYSGLPDAESSAILWVLTKGGAKTEPAGPAPFAQPIVPPARPAPRPAAPAAPAATPASPAASAAAAL
ncbi:N-acetylmuramoyl-L-alanine amidase [Rubrivivax rivuli]|uniref:N-acetylmuramoyl-L-alanine amidase n=1 Tax=Rubrivivax rivuli TaxID=1862385 RepID=A0A437RR88_9BURK|nr:N-acetylmuramoyl-L-alanine amidase [Rubrivivax rivuli]RVU49299.1 N-acetylmuramoyl-L-alanine amidase [Rubrivivax rivuli]